MLYIHIYNLTLVSMEDLRTTFDNILRMVDDKETEEAIEYVRQLNDKKYFLTDGYEISIFLQKSKKTDTSDPSPEAILGFLATHTEPVPTIQIAKHFHGDNGRRKLLNPLLYALERGGKIKKICNENGGKPAWELVKKID